VEKCRSVEKCRTAHIVRQGREETILVHADHEILQQLLIFAVREGKLRCGVDSFHRNDETVLILSLSRPLVLQAVDHQLQLPILKFVLTACEEEVLPLGVGLLMEEQLTMEGAKGR
jgi:hypothetical protein